MPAHQRDVCAVHRVIISQCRCPGAKVTRYVPCPGGEPCLRAPIRVDQNPWRVVARSAEMIELEYVMPDAVVRCCFTPLQAQQLRDALGVELGA